MITEDLTTRAEAFRALHEKSAVFVMPCAWDVFSARVFEHAGYLCIGTTSGGVNWINGRKDYVYTTPMEEMLSVYGNIASAVLLPVSGDLENGYGDEPAVVAETIRTSIANGMVGGSIEDSKIVPTDEQFNDGSLYDIDFAADRIKAARAAADSTGVAYTLTARCEVSYTASKKPFADAVERLNAYREAGADCLFVPGINDTTNLARLVKEVDGPISFGMGATEEPLTVSQLEDIGIRRISTGGGLTRATFGLLQQAADVMLKDGTFAYLNDALSEAEVTRLLN